MTELWGRHDGQTLYVCGFGSSLLDFDWGRLAGRTVIACNNAITRIPDATYHLWADGCLYRHYWNVPYGERTLVIIQAAGTRRMRTAYEWAHHQRLRLFERITGPSPDVVTRDSSDLWVNTTVAATAIMFAWKLGARRVFLLGVDGYVAREQAYYADGTALPDGFGPIEWLPNGRGVQDRHRQWAADMGTLAEYFGRQIRERGAAVPVVYNCNPLSTISAWPKIDREDVL